MLNIHRIIDINTKEGTTASKKLVMARRDHVLGLAKHCRLQHNDCKTRFNRTNRDNNEGKLLFYNTLLLSKSELVNPKLSINNQWIQF